MVALPDLSLILPRSSSVALGVLPAVAPLLDEHGIVAKIANNEALSVAMVNGAQMAGCQSVRRRGVRSGIRPCAVGLERLLKVVLRLAPHALANGRVKTKPQYQYSPKK